MRSIRQDITGKTDATGATTITIKLPVTGEWRLVKLAATLPAPAEWALSASGTPLTYGRGRRVTLGPELIQDGEMLTLAITGGPPAQLVAGALIGVSGAPDEIVRAWAPQPNTIALDTASPQGLVTNVSASAGATVTQSNKTVTVGTQSIGYIVRSDAGNDTPVHVIIQGSQTNNDYTSSSPPANIGGVNWYPFSSTDTAVNVTLHANAINPSSIDVLESPLALAVDITAPFGTLLSVALTDPGTSSQAGVTALGQLEVTQQTAIPALWQAAQHMIGGSFAAAAGADHTLVAAQSGQTIYVFDLMINHNGNVSYLGSLWDGASAGGKQLGEARLPTADTASTHLVGAGAGGTLGNALVFRPDSEQAGTTTYFTLSYSQG